MRPTNASTTRFSWVYDPSIQKESMDWNTVVSESSNAIAMPSKGSIVPGWTLVLPKKPVLNLSQLSIGERNEVCNLAAELQPRLAQFGGSVFQFEHGASHVGSEMGCGVDLAHLHVVPLDFDLISEVVSQTSYFVEWHEVQDSSDTWTKIFSSEYLIVRAPFEGRAVVGAPLQTSSQLLRKIIARRVGVPDSWDYKNHPFSANVARTLTAFGKPSTV